MKKDFETAFKQELEELEEGLYDSLEEQAKDLIKPIKKQQKGTIARYIVRKAKEKKGFNSNIGLKLAELISEKI